MISAKVRNMGGFFLLALLIGAAGCASPMSRGVLDEVDEGISFETLLQDPEAFRGETVLLGGEVIRTENLEERTEIYVLQHPLGLRDKPASGDVSYGRFIVSVTGFLDPAIYAPGRKVTVAGMVTGKRVEQVEGVRYTYPVLDKRDLHLWPKERTYGTGSGVHFGVGIGIGL